MTDRKRERVTDSHKVVVKALVGREIGVVGSHSKMPLSHNGRAVTSRFQ